MAFSRGIEDVVAGFEGMLFWCICGVMPVVWAPDSEILVPAVWTTSAASLITFPGVVVPVVVPEAEGLLELDGTALMPGFLFVEVEFLRPGRFGRACDMAFNRPLADRRFGAVFGGGSGGDMQGDKLYLIHVFTSKKSMGYSSFVYLFMKHLPSRGRRAYDVRIVKFTWAVRTREERSTSSPFRRGPRMLTHVCGTPAYTTPATSSGYWLMACRVRRPPRECAIMMAPRFSGGTSGWLHGKLFRYCINLSLSRCGDSLQS